MTRNSITISGKTRKTATLNLDFVGTDTILFWEKTVLALTTGGICYYRDQKNTGGQTKAILQFAAKAPLVRSADQDFDFVLGSLLTKTGLPLTRRS